MTSEHLSQKASEASRTLSAVGVLALFVCSAFFALYASNSAYTSDEVWSVRASSLDYSSRMEVLRTDVHPPLYYQILHPWMRMFGTEERNVRALSGLFYVLAVFALFALGKDLYGTRTALLCATLFATSPLSILSGQFARMYALLALLSVLSTWLYLQFSIKPRDSHLMKGLYVGINILGTFTHVGFFFVVLGQIVFHLIFFRRTRIKSFILCLALSMVPYTVLWSPILLGQIAHSNEGLAWLEKPGLSSVVELLFLYGGSFWLLLPALAYFWWRTGFQPLSIISKLRLSSLPLWLLVTTVLVPFMLSQVKPVFNPRFAVIGLPFFALSIGALVGKASGYLLLSALTVLTAVGIVALHPGSTICDNRAIAVHLSQAANDGDVVIFTSLTRLPIDYYLAQIPQQRKLIETSFPAEIDQHPGYEGRVSNPDRRASLEFEARELVENIARMKSTEPRRRIFLLHGFRPGTDSILHQKLRHRFELLADQGLQCGQVSSYFKEISVFR